MNLVAVTIATIYQQSAVIKVKKVVNISVVALKSDVHVDCVSKTNQRL